MIERFASWLVATIGDLGYLGIAALMAVESSAIPFPSEVVMPPAGYLAFKGEMNLGLALLAGLCGSLVGAYANYYVASRLGRWFFVRYGRWFLLSTRSLERAERYFARHGEITTFVGRLLPAIRQLISIPAGIARMRLDRFLLFTGAGAGLWCAVLLGIGWLIGRTGADRASAELINRYSHQVVVIMIPALVVLVAGYVVVLRRRAAGVASAAEAAGTAGAGATASESAGQGGDGGG
jgi:membrane protein DedA with SNARE-associated domain